MSACLCTGECAALGRCPRAPNYTSPTITPTGWTCGRCGASVSPYVTTCPHCSRPNFVITYTNN